MALSSKQIAEKLTYVRNDPNPRSAAFVVWQMLLLSLSPTQSRIFDYIVEHAGVSSMEIAAELRLAQNHCDNELKQLRDYGLIEGTPTAGPQGLHYIWREYVF